MISVSEALTILERYRVTTKIVSKDLSECLGHRLAEDIVAKLTLPPHDASAMDGYAVRLVDSRTVGTQLRVIGEVPAGHVFDGEVGAGQAVRIFTGSPLPKGADHIVIQENVEREGDTITLTEPNDEPRHIRRAGMDFKVGDKIVSAGQRIGPPEIALAAATNHDTLSVFSKSRLAVIAAGDELVMPGQAQSPGDIVNSNTLALSALIQAWGGEVIYTHLEKDEPEAIEAMFKRAMDADIIVPVGGASVGDHDHMRRVFAGLGGEMIFEKIAVKPGKPTWLGTLEGRIVLGLPGNPASALVCAHLFLRTLMNGSQTIHLQASLTEDLPSNGPRESYLRGRLDISHESERLRVTPFPRQDSSLLTPFLAANSLIRRHPNAKASYIGDDVEVLLIDPLRLAN